MGGPTRDSSTAELARYAVDVASERLASDIALLDLRGVSDFTEYFVIASGETARHLESLAEDLAHALRDSGVHLHHREGTGQGGWILLDFPGLVVHLFTRQVRERYGLERLWARAPEILRVQ
jgi:ribosome-associated protein